MEAWEETVVQRLYSQVRIGSTAVVAARMWHLVCESDSVLLMHHNPHGKTKQNKTDLGGCLCHRGHENVCLLFLAFES